MLGEGNEPSLRGLAAPVRLQNGKPFCHVTARSRLPRTFASLTGGTDFRLCNPVNGSLRCAHRGTDVRFLYIAMPWWWRWRSQRT